MKLIIILIFSLFILTGCAQNENTSNYSSERTAYEINVPNNYNSSATNIHESEELFEYRTTIYTKTEARQNNVKLACNQLSGCVITPGETFSFCDTLRSC